MTKVTGKRLENSRAIEKDIQSLLLQKVVMPCEPYSKNESLFQRS